MKQAESLRIIFSLYALFFLAAGLMPVKAKTFIAGEEQYSITAEKMPAPIGGYEAVIKKVVYPEVAQRAGVEGKVYLLIYINESGDVDDVKVVKGIGMGCDEEAIKAVKKTKFSPGADKGAPVKTKFSMAVTFKL